MTSHNRRWTFALGAVLVATPLALARVALRERLAPEAILQWVRASQDAVWAVPGFFALFFAGTAMLMPAIALHVAAGAVWGFTKGWLIGLAASNLASTGHFFIGRWVGPERVRAWLVKRAGSKMVDALEQRGVFAMIVIRQMPLPFVAVNVAVGASPMKWRHFVVGNAIGLLPNATIYTYFAAQIAEGVEGAREGALIRAMAAAVIAIGLGLLSRRLLNSPKR